MNFFGHVAVAAWRAASHDIALGAMLPDLAGMCWARIAHVSDDDIAAGVALHHRTDAVFHGLAGFIALERATVQRLRAAGLGKGSARGAAHIAVELFIDSTLLDDAAVCELYLAAVERTATCQQAITWQDAAHAMRWDALSTRLRSAGLPHAYRDPDAVAARIERILASRPLLALAPGEGAILCAELAATRAHVLEEDGAPAILSALAAALT